VDLGAIGSAAQIEAAATNAADSAAKRIRSDARWDLIILTIGPGGARGYPRDQAFIQRISTDPASASYNAAQPAGLYIYSPTTASCGRAFLRMASEIFRLSH
jgi:hypothetical protein